MGNGKNSMLAISKLDIFISNVFVNFVKGKIKYLYIFHNSKTASTGSSTTTTPMMNEEWICPPLFIGLGGVYYFFMKKKPEDTTPSFNYTIQPTQAPTSSTSSGPKGFMDKMKHLNRRMVVFYGSQTGTGEEFAGRLAKEGF